MNKRYSLYRKMIMKKERSFAKSIPTEMDDFDKDKLNILLKYIERYVIVMFDVPIPDQYIKLIERLRLMVPTNVQNEFFALGSTPVTIGHYIYYTAYATIQMSLNKPDDLKAVIKEILDLFGKYRQVSPLAVNLGSSSGSSSPATSTLSNISETEKYEGAEEAKDNPPKEL